MKVRKQKQIITLLMSLMTSIAMSGEPVYEEEAFSDAELDQMLAPIALYPDVLLTQVLMAATYPLEVVEASRWSKAHPDLSGDEAQRAAEIEDWDRSIQYLVGFPDLIQLMDENLSWTRRLGDAFLMQEETVMERTQILRRRSLEAGSLDSLAQIQVEEEEDIIILEPRNVSVIHVPYYSSRAVYGDWWWYDYPPVYWNPPVVHYGRVGLCWSRGFRVSTGFYFSAFDWHLGHIVIRSRYPGTRYYDHDWYRHRNKHERAIWRHDYRHRRGVAYHDRGLDVRYGKSRSSGRTHQAMPPRQPVRRPDWYPDNRYSNHRNDYRSQRSGRNDQRVHNDPMKRPSREKVVKRERSVRDSRPGKRNQPAELPDRYAHRNKKPDRGQERAAEENRSRQKSTRDKPKPPRREPVVRRPEKQNNRVQAARPDAGRTWQRGEVAGLGNDRPRPSQPRDGQRRPRDP